MACKAAHGRVQRDRQAASTIRISHYVPMTALGRDLDFEELRTRWGLSGIVLTHGAWRDRPFPVEGADQFVDRGLVYQNPLIYWFNHYNEKAYNGPRYELTPGAIVVGGGLASIDVVKVLQIEMTLRALRRAGSRKTWCGSSARESIRCCTTHNLKWAELGVAPCKLYYRRRVLDMPLSDIAPDATPKRAEAMRSARGENSGQGAAQISVRVPGAAAFRQGSIAEKARWRECGISATEVADGQGHESSPTAPRRRARRSRSARSAVSRSRFRESAEAARSTCTSIRKSVS